MRKLSDRAHDHLTSHGATVKLTKPEVAFRGLVPALVGIIRQWAPGDLSSEIKYRDSLLAFLRERLPEDCVIENEYRAHGTTTDLHIQWAGLLRRGEAFIEIKRNLNKKAVLDRLVGQLESLKPGENEILVVLVGQIDRRFLGRLQAKYEHLSGFTDEASLEIVTKDSTGA